MQELKDKKIDDWGRVIYKSNTLFEQLYSGQSITDHLADKSNDIEQYNKFINLFDIDLPQIKHAEDPGISPTDFHSILQNEWLIPDEYRAINLEDYLLNKCDTDIERTRVKTELKLFGERDMLNILRFLIYLVDTMRKNNVVWGVGRGSSVSSYVLYLVGIHRVNSLKYNLDITEFLR
jgi:DNA polymerase III alpha subunit